MYKYREKDTAPGGAKYQVLGKRLRGDPTSTGTGTLRFPHRGVGPARARRTLGVAAPIHNEKRGAGISPPSTELRGSERRDRWRTCPLRGSVSSFIHVHARLSWYVSLSE